MFFSFAFTLEFIGLSQRGLLLGSVLFFATVGIIASTEDLYIRCLRVSHFPYSARGVLQSCRLITAPCIDYDLKTCPDPLLSMECAYFDIVSTSFVLVLEVE